MHQLFNTIFLLFVVFLVSCARVDPQKEYINKLFSDQTETVFIELDYMQGTLPETIDQNSGLPVWELLRYNLNYIFSGTKNLLIPLTSSDMDEIPAENKNYNRQDLVHLAMQHRASSAWDGKQASIYILWVDGYFQNDQQETETSVLGLSISGQAMLVVFKPAVELASSSFPHYEAYAQQIVVNHEIGHVIGLVNNGLPITSNHLDDNASHGSAHCNNLSCIMYWQNESRVHDIANYVEVSNDFNMLLFGPFCLEDVNTF
ncbi:hypothetical protein MRY82_08280 [bacterium]|nr:hypothetical protein [bacterium]